MRRLAFLVVVLSCIANVPACGSPPRPRASFFVTTLRPPGSRVACDDCLTERPRVPVQTGSVDSNAITVDDTQRFQTIDGFGFAMTDSSAYLIDQLPNEAGQRDALMRELFDVDDGIGISWVRIIMAASDFTVVKPPWYSYRPSRADPFNVGRARTGSPRGDYSHIIPLLRQANLLSKRKITFFANPHSAPAWMKLNQTLSNFEPDSCILGYCVGATTSEDVRNDYVEYFVDFIKAYEAKGVQIDAVGVQNEPGTTADYPSGDFAPADQADFINRLKLELARQDPPLTQKVLGESTNPADALEILADPPNPAAIDGVSYHCYGLDAKSLQQGLAAVAAFHAAYPDKTIHETECTQDASEIWPKTIDILIDHSRSGANSVAGWNLALDPRGGPHSVLCAEVRDGQCYDTSTSSILTAPVVITGAAGRATARFTREYYEMGHFTKFVRPGAVRIGSGELGSVKNAAFENLDRSRVLVVHNTADAPRSFAVNIDGDRHFDVDDLPADSIATFTW